MMMMIKMMMMTMMMIVLLMNICNSSTVMKPIKTLIVGAGPAGLLTSHALLSKNKNGAYTYDVNLVESRDNPLNEPQGPRAYSLGLNIRGQVHKQSSSTTFTIIIIITSNHHDHHHHFQSSSSSLSYLDSSKVFR